MRIASGGRIFIVVAIGPLAAALPGLWPAGSPLPVILATSSLVGLAAFFWFFRDPARSPGTALPGTVAVSPADGRVLEAEEGPEGPHLAVYLNLLDVHVTRLPLESKIVRVSRMRGTHRVAGRVGARANARVVTECETQDGRMRVSQISGLMARRIVPYLSPGEKRERGARLGLIRFGSRVEVRFPKGYRLLVARGMQVRAGETPVAERCTGPDRREGA